MTTNLRHILVGGGTPVTSGITGRELLVNGDPLRFRVPASYTAAGAAAAEAAFLAYIADGSRPERRRWEQSADGHDVLRALAARTPADLAAALDPIADGLLHTVTPKRFGGLTPAAPGREPLNQRAANRSAQVFAILGRHGCVLAPLADARFGLFFGQRHMRFGPEVYGRATELSTVGDGNTGAILVRWMLAAGGTEEIGDFSAEVLTHLAAPWRENDPELEAAVDALVPGLFARATLVSNKQLTGVLRNLAKRQRAEYASRPDLVAKIPATYADVRPDRKHKWAKASGEAPTRDKSFAWIARDFPHGVAWQPMLAEYLATRAGVLDVRGPLSGLARGARALLASDAPPATPIDACRMAKASAAVLGPEATRNDSKSTPLTYLHNTWRSFFHWVVTVKARRADGSLDPALSNPVDFIASPRKEKRKPQSTRPKMPGWLIQKAVELVRGNDYEWPRSRTNDYFDVVEDGAVKRVWSPVVAELTLLRFVLPIRATQARLLGSGEGDAWVWVPGDGPGADGADEEAAPDAARSAGRWEKNTSEWRPPAHEERALGFLRRMWDPDEGTWTNGLYISTNKTADKTKGFVDLGYEIPWLNAEILAIYNRVLRFQQRHNPARAPKSRADLSREPTMIPEDVAPLLPKMHFLFRDAAHQLAPDEPVTAFRVVAFWNDMMAELERRIANDPEVPRNADGSPPQLVTKWNETTGRPAKVRYDGHSVRVTGITRLALGGCPVQVLMMLAGHATWVMTLYYVKMTPGDVRRALDEAEERLEELDATELEEALASVDPEALRRFRVATSDDGLQQLKAHDEALMAATDLGLCPNGGTLCHIGGPEVESANGGGVHGPVPGGAANCQSCRFLVSGPQYLGGIVARINALTVQVVAAGERLRDTERHRRSLVAERRAAGASPPAALLRRLRRAQASVEAAEANAEDMSARWQNLHRLYERCLKALRELMRRNTEPESSTGRNLLVLNGAPHDVQTALQRCSDVALWNRVCFDSEVWDSVDATESAVRRGMRLDHLLAQSGRPAVFAGLTDGERVAVGNAFARWLETRLGVVGADEIYEGRRTLAEAGLLDDLDMVLPRARPGGRGAALLPDARRLLPASTT